VSEAKPAASSGPSAAVHIGRFVLTAVVILAVTALVIATWANWRRDRKVTFHVFDPAWWGIGKHEAQPYVDGARTAAENAYASVWGAGGLVEQAEAWIATRPKDAAAIPGADIHEAAFTQAETQFEDGVVAYKRAKPSAEKATDRTAVREAISAFTACRDLLAEHLPAYAKLPQHKEAELSKAQDLERINARFLAQAQRLAAIR